MKSKIIPHKFLNNKTPLIKLFSKKPDLCQKFLCAISISGVILLLILWQSINASLLPTPQPPICHHHGLQCFNFRNFWKALANKCSRSKLHYLLIHCSMSLSPDNVWPLSPKQNVLSSNNKISNFCVKERRKTTNKRKTLSAILLPGPSRLPGSSDCF